MTAQRAGGWQLSPSGRTLALEDRDYPQWHTGRLDYAVWLITADLAPVRERIAQVRAAFEHFSTGTRMGKVVIRID